MELSPSPPPSPEGRWADLPDDIAVAIACRLQVPPISVFRRGRACGSLVDWTCSCYTLAQEADVCALGGCSRSWRRACDANFVWEGLFRRRWPAAAAAVAAGGGAGASRVQVAISADFPA
jgi:hypothetical protein